MHHNHKALFQLVTSGWYFGIKLNAFSMDYFVNWIYD